MLSEQKRNDLIAAIRALPDEVEALDAGLDAEQLIAHYILGEWTVAQNVHHLVDSHINSYVRCKLMATEDCPAFRPYDEKAWAELPDASSPDLSYSLAILRSLHTRWAVFWETLPAEAWRRTGYHPDGGVTMTLEDQLRLYVDHGAAHLTQMRRALAAA